MALTRTAWSGHKSSPVRPNPMINSTRKGLISKQRHGFSRMPSLQPVEVYFVGDIWLNHVVFDWPVGTTALVARRRKWINASRSSQETSMKSRRANSQPLTFKVSRQLYARAVTRAEGSASCLESESNWQLLAQKIPGTMHPCR